jgi:hypothetical protein
LAQPPFVAKQLQGSADPPQSPLPRKADATPCGLNLRKVPLDPGRTPVGLEYTQLSRAKLDHALRDLSHLAKAPLAERGPGDPPVNQGSDVEEAGAAPSVERDRSIRTPANGQRVEGRHKDVGVAVPSAGFNQGLFQRSRVAVPPPSTGLEQVDSRSDPKRIVIFWRSSDIHAAPVAT